MLQISLPFGGDELNLQIQNVGRKVNTRLLEAYLSDFVDAAIKELNWVDHHSGLSKLKHVANQSEAYLPWIVANYANFHLHAQRYQDSDYSLAFPQESQEIIVELLVELNPHVASVASELFAAFLIEGAKTLAQVSGLRDFVINTRDWVYLSENQEVALLNPLTESFVEFSSANSAFIKLDADNSRQEAYVYTSSLLSHLCALQLDLRHGLGRAQATDKFLQQHSQNQCFTLDTDNQVSPLIA